MGFEGVVNLFGHSWREAIAAHQDNRIKMVRVGPMDLALGGSEDDLGHGTIIVDTEERPPWA
jgi:hypothetical protein